MPEGAGTAVEEHPFDLARLCRYFSEHSPMASLALEGETHIVRSLNPAFERLVGKDRSEMIGRPFADAVPEGEENGCLALLDRVYRTGQPENLVEQQHRHDKLAYWSYAVWAVLGADERPAGVMIQVTDATETATFRKLVTAANQALLLSSIRQQELAETAEKLNARLRTAIEDKEYFMAVLSHELRTPLTPVLAALSILRRDETLGDETRETVEMIHRNVALEARLIDDLLDMTRIERGKMDVDRRPVDLRAVIGRAVEVCRPDLEAAGLDLEVDLEGGPFVVEGDAIRLQQVVWNLLRNSIKFTPAGGRVRVHCRPDGDSHVVTEVIDNGTGIDAAILPRVFGSFERGDKTQNWKLGGLGLGLAISKTIVEMHGGTIAARSAGKDQGTTISVRLPILAGAGPSRGKEPPGASNGAATRPVGPLRILLVEDHLDTVWVMSRLLAGDGHAVQSASDVATGLKLATEHPFDLLISDLGLPDGSGTDLMRGIRERGSPLVGIALSGFGQDEDIARSLEAGFVTHLTKPVDHDVLQAAIRAAYQWSTA